MPESKFLKSGTVFNDLCVVKLDNVKVREFKDKRTEKTYKANKEFYLCRCFCGKETVVAKRDLVSGHTKSCGCRKKNSYLNFENKTHGKTHTPLYRVWDGMKTRCFNKNSKDFKRYGGRGIVVCDTWKVDFQSFYDWAIKSGYKNGLSIDRIDVNGNYEPKNCRWATIKQQSNNKRTSKIICYKGESKTLSEWCEELGLNYSRTNARLNICKWSVEKAFNYKDTDNLKLIFRIH